MTVIALIYSGAREYSVRQYLKGFSDASVPASVGIALFSTPEMK
jgi:hypothetical protein